MVMLILIDHIDKPVPESPDHILWQGESVTHLPETWRKVTKNLGGRWHVHLDDTVF
jgi:hypothetical protein